MNLLQQIVYKTRYAKWLPDEKRREHWPETVERYIQHVVLPRLNMAGEGVSETRPPHIVEDIRQSIISLEVMPSMRMLMTAGPALDRDHIAGYNCAYMAIKSKRDFAECLYILMNGTGVGFSCERQYVNSLPLVPNELHKVDDVIVVADSKLGWAKAYNKLVSSLYEGDIPSIDYSKIRPAGARLKTFGGRASGPDPLRRLFEHTIQTFKLSQGRRLSSIEVHDIMCTIGEVVVVGGVRRSALISLSNLTDRRMREAKVGAWWEDNRQRALANNSVAYTEKPDSETFLEEFLSLIKSKSGERGIFNRVAARRQASRFGRRSADIDYGCNPCSEILLRDKQFCNLTEVVIRPSDNVEDVRRKLRVATILGTIQSCFTDFGFISDEWRDNCEEERLLGVSLTGIYDNNLFNGRVDGLPERLRDLRQYVRDVNEEWAVKLGINPSAAITCVKPSGTVSQLVDSASGIHPRFARHYVRNIRMDKKDPVCEFLKNAGLPAEPDNQFPESQVVFSFPCSGGVDGLVRSDLSALDHLKLWKTYQDDYCEHKPSVTISCKPSEWPSVAAWTYEHFDDVSGISFLPYSDHTYKQAPYIECTAEEYEAMAERQSKVELEWGTLKEEVDETTASQELACTGNVCEI
jgi:ribonucleoside-triphosphate reductase